MKSLIDPYKYSVVRSSETSIPVWHEFIVMASDDVIDLYDQMFFHERSEDVVNIKSDCRRCLRETQENVV